MLDSDRYIITITDFDSQDAYFVRDTPIKVNNDRMVVWKGECLRSDLKDLVNELWKEVESVFKTVTIKRLEDGRYNSVFFYSNNRGKEFKWSIKEG